MSAFQSMIENADMAGKFSVLIKPETRIRTRFWPFGTMSAFLKSGHEASSVCSAFPVVNMKAELKVKSTLSGNVENAMIMWG